MEKLILFFREQGVAGERLSDTIARVGFEQTCRMLESDDLLRRKAAILAE